MEFERAAEKLRVIMEANAIAVHGGDSLILEGIKHAEEKGELLLCLNAAHGLQSEEAEALQALLEKAGVDGFGVSHASNTARMAELKASGMAETPLEKNELIFHIPLEGRSRRTGEAYDNRLEEKLDAALEILAETPVREISGIRLNVRAIPPDISKWKN